MKAQEFLFGFIDEDERGNYRAILKDRNHEILFTTEYCASRGIIYAEADKWQREHQEYTKINW